MLTFKQFITNPISETDNNILEDTDNYTHPKTKHQASVTKNADGFDVDEPRGVFFHNTKDSAHNYLSKQGYVKESLEEYVENLMEESRDYGSYKGVRYLKAGRRDMNKAPIHILHHETNGGDTPLVTKKESEAKDLAREFNGSHRKNDIHKGWVIHRG